MNAFRRELSWCLVDAGVWGWHGTMEVTMGNAILVARAELDAWYTCRHQRHAPGTADQNREAQQEIGRRQRQQETVHERCCYLGVSPVPR
eukprot:8273854-Lingulodinium_polyedra.AAC.1